MDGTLKFVLPAATAPRLTNRDVPIDSGEMDAGDSAASTDVNVNYTFDAEIGIEMPSAITGLECPSHGVDNVAVQVGSYMVFRINVNTAFVLECHRLRVHT